MKPGISFQSRNRDAFHFRKDAHQHASYNAMFQSRNRDAFHFRLPVTASAERSVWFQSRNRDAFHFRISQACDGSCGIRGEFQSRNRDAFHFRSSLRQTMNPTDFSFNLAIEMLFISGSNAGVSHDTGLLFQSRNRDAFHFRLPGVLMGSEGC